MAKSLKILYLSSHEVLEYDELKIFGELGHKYLSLGAYYNPFGDESTGKKRPTLPAEWNLFDEFKGNYDRFNLTKEQVDPFDVIIIMHHPESEQPWILKNWERIKHKKVIYRSIGQSIRITEKALGPLKRDGLMIVRYSPKEATIPFYCGEDALIRFYKDPEEFKDWNGQNKLAINITQSMADRRGACNYDAFLKITEPFERRLFGTGNENTGLIGGFLPFEAMKKELRDSRVYVYTGTQPASYTLNFMEAWLTGIPIVALGAKHCNRDYPEQQTYEVDSLVENGVNGFVSDDIEELRGYVRSLLDDDKLAQKISAVGRESAIKYFGKETIKQQWKEFLERIA